MAFISSPLGHLPTNTMTPEQLNKVKAKFCLSVTDNMDIDTLIEIVYDQLIQSYEQYDERDMQEEITSYFNDDGEEYNNLLREVTPIS
jgi:hypothetical protein|tara:strand:- start:90 stop:353 length:264 start_codon:yes stop_codon:yes gene_type:complete